MFLPPFTVGSPFAQPTLLPVLASAIQAWLPSPIKPKPEASYLPSLLSYLGYFCTSSVQGDLGWALPPPGHQLLLSPCACSHLTPKSRVSRWRLSAALDPCYVQAVCYSLSLCFQRSLGVWDLNGHHCLPAQSYSWHFLASFLPGMWFFIML